MTDQLSLKYARIERERRFLVTTLPKDATVVRVRQITDYYINGTRLRLREQRDDDGSTIFKLTQKIPLRAAGAQQGLITNTYLNEAELSVLRRLPAKVLRKTRYSVPPFGIDVFAENLAGLLLAEAEFESAEAAAALELPAYIANEVTSDDRFTGGRLAHASRQELKSWLSEYDVALVPGRD
jgi:CYTH domain-containing protein